MESQATEVAQKIIVFNSSRLDGKNIRGVLIVGFGKVTRIPLKIIGEGPQAQFLRAYANEHNLNNVEFMGPKWGQEMQEVVSRARCVVCPSEWYENSPLVDGTIRQANVPARRGRIWLWSLGWAQCVIANSRAGLEAFGISPARGRVVYNGLDAERLSICVRTPREPTAPFTAIMVGRMHPMKDYASFVEAARLAAQSDRKTWRFVAMGSGPQRAMLSEQTQDLAEQGIFLMPEPSLEVLPHVCGADIGVLMTSPGSHAEGCSNAIMEYMACGLPVVCSDSGGNRELVLDGQTGFVIPPGDVKALVDRLFWLRHNPEEATRMGNAGRRRLREEFTVDRLVTDTLAVYADALAERRR